MRTPQQPLVSIVIPCYQQAHYLEEAIESVLAQTYPHYEIIVVDDGSPDDTAAVAARYPPVRYIRQKNQGLAAARNTGLRASQGAYLTFLDADDRLTPGALARGVSCLTEHPEAGLVFGCYRKINAQGELLPTCPPAYAGSDLYHDLLKFNCIGMVCNVMYRRAVFDRLGGFDPNISPAADYDLYLRVAREFPVAWHHEVVAHYRIHDTSMSHNYAVMLRAVLLGLRKQRKHIKGQPDYEAAYRQGLEAWWQTYGEALYWEAVASLRAGRKVRRALRDLYYLMRYYPLGVARNVADKLARILAKYRKRAPLAQ